MSHGSFIQIGMMLSTADDGPDLGGCSQALAIDLNLSETQLPPFAPPEDAIVFHFRSKNLALKERSLLVSKLSMMACECKATLISEAVDCLNDPKYSEEVVIDAITRSNDLDLTMDGMSFYLLGTNKN